MEKWDIGITLTRDDIYRSLKYGDIRRVGTAGREMCIRDRVYALQKVEQRMNQDPSFKGLVQDIIKNISEN